MGILAMSFAWLRLPTNVRGVLSRQKISLCCGSPESHRAHVEAFMTVRRLVLEGRGPTLSENPDVR
eukprot:7978987-Alexandrium_andersonii.AAC.1